MERLIEKLMEPGAETIGSSWKGLYKIAAVTTVVMMVLFLLDLVIWSVLGPYPSSAEGWFTLLQKDRLVGLLLLSLPTLFGMMLYYLTFLGLFSILRQVNSAYAVLAALFAFVGLSILLATNMAYPMIHLSDQYAMTTIEAKKLLLLAAGETKIVTTATGVNMGGFFVEGSAVIFSLLMLRSKVFDNKTAYLGILGHGLDLTRIVMAFAFLPQKIGAILLMVGGLPQFIWLFLVGRQFFQLGKPELCKDIY